MEPVAEVVGAAPEDRGEDADVVAANGEHPAVEVLALELDRGRVARDDLGVGFLEPVEADQVDGEGGAVFAALGEGTS